MILCQSVGSWTPGLWNGRLKVDWVITDLAPTAMSLGLSALLLASTLMAKPTQALPISPWSLKDRSKAYIYRIPPTEKARKHYERQEISSNFRDLIQSSSQVSYY
jgi:hypothetical protein